MSLTLPPIVLLLPPKYYTDQVDLISRSGKLQNEVHVLVQNKVMDKITFDQMLALCKKQGNQINHN